ncbi:hypothetical protein [Flavobacterium reichenbachii]|uniref:Uncharacterized protein n=1 Tax=Flavobacterium reichenbachii TaxID=362418 RepID=A0A085ZPA6_9FLAO|nr:hypothetical protein [Flavobacterium reichenbachii]KFF06270.1 hypothetical protein IW19_12335 [Flavobacterium reichenbachii]OXB17515.1 hypothetical protein B0A68_04265 [Flavobacterium reichenbachii]
MKFLDFLDLIISGAFALFAFLFYLLNKDQVKRRREEEMNEAFTRAGSFKSWIIIIFSVIFCVVYFFSFINSIVT